MAALLEGGAGEWTARLAGVGLNRLPARNEGPFPAAITSPSDFRTSRDELVHLTKSKIVRHRAEMDGLSTDTATSEASMLSLARGLAALEALLQQLESVDPDSADPGGLTAQLDAARAICEAVDQLLEGR